MFKFTLIGLLFLQTTIIFSQISGNYPTQNGTIIEQKKEGPFEIIVRTHEQIIEVEMYERQPIDIYYEPIIDVYNESVINSGNL